MKRVLLVAMVSALALTACISPTPAPPTLTPPLQTPQTTPSTPSSTAAPNDLCQGSDHTPDNWRCLYVATDGDDETNPGTFASPFATLGRALLEVHTFGPDWQGEVVISIRGGAYYLADTLRLTPENSGQNGHQLIIRPYGEEQVVISGGVPVNNWSQLEDGTWWSADLPSVDFRHLSVNGGRAIRARHPNGADFHTIAGWDPVVAWDHWGACDASEGRRLLGVRAEDAWFAASLGPEHLRRVEVFAERQTGSAILRLDSVGAPNEDGQGITYITPQSPERERLFSACVWQRPGLTYRFENSMAFLDAPGEWYLDSVNQILYYRPRERVNG